MNLAKNPTSFINEHTASYILIPRLKTILHQNYRKVIPLYYWATREGSNRSLNTMIGVEFSVLALYSRRPKLSSGPTENISVKLNKSLFESARIFSNFGISVLAGSPLVRSICQLDSDANCVWFKVQNSTDDLIICCDNSDFRRHELHIEESRIVNFIEHNSKIIDLQKLKLATDEMRSLPGASFSFFSGSGYKPIYFLLIK